MALDNIDDKTEAQFWRTVKPLVTAKENNHWAYHQSSTVRHPRSSGSRNGHSFEYNHYPDDHQLNIMDYVRYLHDAKGLLNYSQMNSSGTEFRLNQGANEHVSDDLSSVTISVSPYYKPGTYDRRTDSGEIDPNAVSRDGHRLYNATFYRYSNSDGRDNYAHNGLDPLNNFMTMVHNHYASKDDQIIPSINIPSMKDRINKRRMNFIRNYHKFYHTYHTGYTAKGLTFNNDQYHDVDLGNGTTKKTKGNIIDRIFMSAHERGEDALVYNDKRHFYKDDVTKSRWRFQHSVLYDYMYKVRGIAPRDLWNLARQDLIRCYQGSVKYGVKKCPDAKTAKKFQKDIKINNKKDRDHQKAYGWSPFTHLGKGIYQPDKKRFLTTLTKYNPMIEFPWRMPNSKPKVIPSDKAKEILKDDPKLKKHKLYGYVQQKDKNGKYTGKLLLAKSKLQPGSKVKGSDRIYLQFNPKSAREYLSKDGKQMTVYMGTNGKVDKSRFSRGKQIGRHSIYGGGWNFKSGTGRDYLFVTECPTDTLSLYNANQEKFKHLNATYLSMGGISKGYMINGMLKKLHANPGEFRHVYICLDNDAGGHRAIEHMMASNHKKIDFVKNGSIANNPVTQDKQSVKILVPGVFRAPKNGRFIKQLTGDLGRNHWKDENDVLQFIRGNGRYKRFKGSSYVNVVRGHPQQEMNISQYSNMIVDDGLVNANRLSNTGRNNARYMKNFFALYGKLQDSVAKGGHISPSNHYVQRMKRQYNQMDGVGQLTLDNMMNSQTGHGAENISPKDLSIYALHQGNVAVNEDEAERISIAPNKFNQNVEHHVNNTMALLSDGNGKSQQLYDLALRSASKVVPVAQHKVTGLRAKATLIANRAFYGHIMGHNASKNSYNLYQQNPVHYMQVRYSMNHCLVPQYVNHNDMNFNVAVKASHKYLKDHGLKQITPQEVFNDNEPGNRPGTVLYKKMQKVQYYYKLHRKAENKSVNHAKTSQAVKPSHRATSSVSSSSSSSNNSSVSRRNGTQSINLSMSSESSSSVKAVSPSSVSVSSSSSSVPSSSSASSGVKSNSSSHKSSISSKHPFEASYAQSKSDNDRSSSSAKHKDPVVNNTSHSSHKSFKNTAVYSSLMNKLTADSAKSSQIKSKANASSKYPKRNAVRRKAIANQKRRSHKHSKDVNNKRGRQEQTGLDIK